MSKSIYNYSSQGRFLIRSDYSGMAYSDGAEVEARLYRIISSARDISCASEELITHISDWPSEYHLSPVRHNLLRPLGLGASDRILELGCGCGAITRYLGETGATVVAVEGSQRRAQIAAERCRDLPNVTIYCDNLADFKTDEKFDYVTLIGVLEYAQLFIESGDPVQTCLELARAYLKEGGTLILAIENQLGLKYFNGCVEDHLGIPYFGISGLYAKGDPETFGRRDLVNRLGKSGFPDTEFFFPFPDYKLPGLILSETGLAEERLNIPDMLMHNTGRDYPESRHRAFAEDMAWRVVANNHLLADLANSFLILARPEGAIRPTTTWLAKIFSRGRRNIRYQVESTIEADAHSSLVVRKRNIFPMTQAADEWLQHVIKDSLYLAGGLLLGKIHKAMAREAGLDELASCFAPWLDFLLANAKQNEKGEEVLPGDFVDCIPANLIENTAGEMQYFDAEWVSKEPIPIGWVVIRGIAYSVIDCLENRLLNHLTYRQFITEVTQRSGMQLLAGDFESADQCEALMVTQCHANAVNTPRLNDFLDQPLFLMIRLSGHVTEFRRSLAWQEAELARIKNTVSWRITAPLRVMWNFYRRLVLKEKASAR